MPIEIRHEPEPPFGAFRAYEDGQALGSMVYVRSGPSTVIIQHTEVLEAGRGKGLGRALFEYMVAWARESGTKVTAQCPFTRKMFAENPETRDILR